MFSTLFSSLYPSLGLRWKLADLGGLHSLSEAGVCPAGTGCVSVGLVGSNRQGQTLLSSESPLHKSEIWMENSFSFPNSQILKDYISP